MSGGKSVSVIVPTLNASRFIGPLIASLNAQSLKPSEVIVIDSGSGDGTADRAEELGATVMRISRGEFDHGGTRNAATRASKGDFLVFMSQDAFPYDDLMLENLLSPFQDPDVAAAFGRQIPRDEASPVEKFARSFNYQEAPYVRGIGDLPRHGIKTFFISNACSAFRKEAFFKSGGFPERVVMGEDMLLAAELVMGGLKIAYVPSARVIHSHSYTPCGQMRRYFDIGVMHSENPRLLENAAPGPEGRRFALGLFAYLIREGKPHWMPYAALDVLARLVGYRLGLLNRVMPRALKRAFAMNKGYFA